LRQLSSWLLGPVNIVRVAERIADEVLFPAALATDASDVVPPRAAARRREGASTRP